MQVLSSHNPLVLILALVTAAGASGTAYLALYVARGKDTPEIRRQFGLVFFLIGLFALGGFAQLVLTDWAGFPAGHYSELFGVATGMFSFMLIAAGLLLFFDMSLVPIAWPSLLIGLYLLQGARAVLDFDLTRRPGLTALMWASAGIASMGMVLYAYAKDEMKRILAWLGAVALGIMAVAAAITGIAAYYDHIERIVTGG